MSKEIMTSLNSLYKTFKGVEGSIFLTGSSEKLSTILKRTFNSIIGPQESGR